MKRNIGPLDRIIRITLGIIGISNKFTAQSEKQGTK